jgi:hypothetical protein
MMHVNKQTIWQFVLLTSKGKKVEVTEKKNKITYCMRRKSTNLLPNKGMHGRFGSIENRVKNDYR